MSEAELPIACPFCGHVGLSFDEGSTFRWLFPSCGGCGASCGEERIRTIDIGLERLVDRQQAIEEAKARTVVTWNKRSDAAIASLQARVAELEEENESLRETAANAIVAAANAEFPASPT